MWKGNGLREKDPKKDHIAAGKKGSMDAQRAGKYRQGDNGEAKKGPASLKKKKKVGKAVFDGKVGQQTLEGTKPDLADQKKRGRIQLRTKGGKKKPRGRSHTAGSQNEGANQPGMLLRQPGKEGTRKKKLAGRGGFAKKTQLNGGKGTKIEKHMRSPGPEERSEREKELLGTLLLKKNLKFDKKKSPRVGGKKGNRLSPTWRHK